MKLKTIRVTQDDIDHGKRGSFCDCPVVLAVKRAFRASLSDRRIAVRHEGIFVGDLEDEAILGRGGGQGKSRRSSRPLTTGSVSRRARLTWHSGRRTP